MTPFDHLQNTAGSRVFCYKAISKKVRYGERLNKEEALTLLHCGDMGFLAGLADLRRRQINGDKLFFNQNFHIEPSNVCIHRCRFCSFRRNHAQEAGALAWSIEEVCQYAREKLQMDTTEVHITGSVHPDRNFLFYTDLIEALRAILPPKVTIKAFSAVEIDGMCKMAGISWIEGLQRLKEKGLSAIAGGGAEIFDPTVRSRICPDKTDAESWLSIHNAAHRIGIASNASMLFGHIETPEQQIDHLSRIRNQQDKSLGFTAFIPLKYRASHNELSHLGETDLLHTLRLFAVSRLFLDNIPHIKAYWPMLGKEATQMALLFGADDIDGTIQQSTKIYSMAGAEEQNPDFTKEEVCALIKAAGYSPVERDSFYERVK